MINKRGKLLQKGVCVFLYLVIMAEIRNISTVHKLYWIVAIKTTDCRTQLFPVYCEPEKLINIIVSETFRDIF